MIDDTDEIRWLKDQQPDVDPPAAEATGWARTSLLLHAQRTSELVCLDSRRKPEDAASADDGSAAARRSEAAAGSSRRLRRPS